MNTITHADGLEAAAVLEACALGIAPPSNMNREAAGRVAAVLLAVFVAEHDVDRIMVVAAAP